MEIQLIRRDDRPEIDFCEHCPRSAITNISIGSNEERRGSNSFYCWSTIVWSAWALRYYYFAITAVPTTHQTVSITCVVAVLIIIALKDDTVTVLSPTSGIYKRNALLHDLHQCLNDHNETRNNQISFFSPRKFSFVLTLTLTEEQLSATILLPLLRQTQGKHQNGWSYKILIRRVESWIRLHNHNETQNNQIRFLSKNIANCLATLIPKHDWSRTRYTLS